MRSATERSVCVSASSPSGWGATAFFPSPLLKATAAESPRFDRCRFGVAAEEGPPLLAALGVCCFLRPPMLFVRLMPPPAAAANDSPPAAAAAAFAALAARSSAAAAAADGGGCATVWGVMMLHCECAERSWIKSFGIHVPASTREL